MKSLKFSTAFLLLGTGPHVLAFESSHLKQFQISQCQQMKCVLVRGNMAYLSVAGDFLAGSNAHLQYRGESESAGFEQNCAVFRYDIRSQFLTCDNRTKPGAKTLFIDSRFKISNIEDIGKI
jgi:hypothetical protein